MTDIRARAASLAYRAGAEIARGLPRRSGEILARGAARCLTVAAPNKRRQVERHLQRVSGGKLTDAELRRATNTMFDNYGRYWHELFRLTEAARPSLEDLMDARGFERIEAGAAAGRGVILALPHLGNWDFAGAWLAGRGFRITVVAEPLEPPDLFEWFVDIRRTLGMDVVALGPKATGAVLRALGENQVVCLLCDRDLSGDGIAVDFFGEETTMPGGPATLALRTGATLIPVGNYFAPGVKHTAEIMAPVPAERTGRLRDDVARVTQALAYRFEELIRAAPEQWLLMQPNWPSDHVAGEAS